MPIVRADLPQGLSDETKEALRQAIKAALAQAIAEAMQSAAGIAAEDIYLRVPRDPGREPHLRRHPAAQLGAGGRVMGEELASRWSTRCAGMSP